MKKIIIIGALVSSLFASSQVGIQTSTPQKTLHINGSLQITSELNVGGNAATAGNAGNAGQVLKSSGAGMPPVWQNLAGVPNSIGTVIVVNGEFLVAQEIVAQMTADFTLPAASPGAGKIGNLNFEIIDNENSYTASTTDNSFKVTTDGTYQIMMNLQLSGEKGSWPVIGIWSDTDGNWVARVNDEYTANTGNSLQTYTLITSIPLFTSKTYSFRVAGTAANPVIIKKQSSGSTGGGPVSQVSVKRLK
ncbi:hypothetical protein [Chryseobacterium herbae]|uniref:Uncharacterized protein n=1 Tax=Chryseobacterium herbae TaxID=2976476 RepID=A0ABT2ITB9_9FLAO|nr:hypothetical protein [Chryseobacterium sp. pc1-10]MCT2562081.1 hypothetical protein [Chryseobacterium sp. pc1-10]